MMIRYVTALSAAGLAWPALAADLALKVEIPRLAVAEYHRPYVAIWIEKPDQSFAGNLAVWYDIKMRNNEGTKWLKDMRAWWRKSGRELNMPVDGLSGATRAPGEHSLQTRVGFEVSSSNLGRDDQEVRRTCILQVDYDGFTAGQRYQLEARPYGFRAMARLRDSNGQVVARGRLVRCGI